VLKRLNRSICCLCWIGLGGPEESCGSVGVVLSPCNCIVTQITERAIYKMACLKFYPQDGGVPEFCLQNAGYQ